MVERQVFGVGLHMPRHLGTESPQQRGQRTRCRSQRGGDQEEVEVRLPDINLLLRARRC